MNVIDWYNTIAKRSGGYRVIVPFETVGKSAEDVFELELIRLLDGRTVLDAGCAKPTSPSSSLHRIFHRTTRSRRIKQNLRLF